MPNVRDHRHRTAGATSAGSEATKHSACQRVGVRQLVDQNPVWFDVTVAMSAQTASKLVISILGGKSFLGEKYIHDGLHLCEAFASFLHPLEILLELAGLAEPHLSQEAYRSPAVSNVSIS